MGLSESFQKGFQEFIMGFSKCEKQRKAMIAGI